MSIAENQLLSALAAKINAAATTLQEAFNGGKDILKNLIPVQFRKDGAAYGRAEASLIADGGGTDVALVPVGDMNSELPISMHLSRLLADAAVTLPAAVSPYVATTISFSEPDLILDSANGFLTAGLENGDIITISGTSLNNVSIKIGDVQAGQIELGDGPEFVNESAGASVTITVAKNKIVFPSDLRALTTPPAVIGDNAFGFGSMVLLKDSTDETDESILYRAISLDATGTILGIDSLTAFVVNLAGTSGTAKIANLSRTIEGQSPASDPESPANASYGNVGEIMSSVETVINEAVVSSLVSLLNLGNISAGGALLNFANFASFIGRTADVPFLRFGPWAGGDAPDIVFSPRAADPTPEVGGEWWNTIDARKRIRTPAFGGTTETFAFLSDIKTDNILQAVTSPKVSGNYLITVNDENILADTNGSVVTLTLPASPVDGQTHRLTLLQHSLTCTIARNGNLLDGAAADNTTWLNADRTSVTLQFSSAFGGFGWYLIARI